MWLKNICLLKVLFRVIYLCFLTKATHSLLPSVKGKASIFIRNLKLLRYKIELSNWLADRDLQSAVSGQRSAVGGQRLLLPITAPCAAYHLPCLRYPILLRPQ